MQKRIITLLCAVGLAISVPSNAAGLKVRPDAPTRYVVKQGDTLWGISGRYLYSPWQWSRLWGANRSEIRNPHWIYPGQVLVLRYVNGQPRLGFENNGGIPAIKLKPRVRETSSGYGIQTVDINFYRMFMQYPQIISSEEVKNAPTLIAGREDRSLYAKGDRVYAQGITKPGRYLAYRINRDITDPQTRQSLGTEIVFSGIVATLTDEPAPVKEKVEKPEELIIARPMVVEDSVSEIHKGDRLMPLEEGDIKFNALPHAPSQHINADVLAIYDSVSEAGPFQTIMLNKGSVDGLDEGTVLSVYKRSKIVRLDVSGSQANSDYTTQKKVYLPSEEIGLAMVYRVSDRLASAIVLESTSNISIGDSVSEPGHDLEELQEYN